MSKLLIAIVHQDDAGDVADAMRKAGHRFTQLPSVGGFLGSENTTFVFGVDDAVVGEIVGIFQEVCQERDLDVPLVLMERLADWQARTVAYGGATILVADLERIIRV